MDPRTVISNVLDPIHDTLSPHMFDKPGEEEPKLKPVHRDWIVERVHAVAEKFHPKAEDWLSLVLTGSLTTYQFSEASDVDISLFVDHNVLPDWDRAKLIGIMVDQLDGVTLPGTPYPMQCFVVPPEIHREDLYQHGLRSGYDLDADQWIIPPDRGRTHNVEREYNAYYVYALESADKMERLLKYDPDKAVMFWHQIHKRRQRDQRAGKGDFSEANIVYKFLANRGLFPAISEASGEYIAKTANVACPNCGVELKDVGPCENCGEHVGGDLHGGSTEMPPLPKSLQPKSAVKPRVIYQEIKNFTPHPGANDSPFIYDPKTNIAFLGPPKSYHWDLIKRIPELRPSYPEDRDFKQPPTSVSSDHLHGRVDMRKGTGIFYGGDEETKQTVADAIGFKQVAPVVDKEDHWDDVSGPTSP